MQHVLKNIFQEIFLKLRFSTCFLMFYILKNEIKSQYQDYNTLFF
jgi:hypothetical protein